MTRIDPSRFWSVPEAARFLGITRQAAHDAVSRGAIPSRTLAGRTVVRITDVQRYAKRRHLNAGSPTANVELMIAAIGELNDRLDALAETLADHLDGHVTIVPDDGAHLTVVPDADPEE